jgi:hypothetical protein
MSETESVIGKEVILDTGQKEIMENCLAYRDALDHLFVRLCEEVKNRRIKDGIIWGEAERIAIEQYPGFDPAKHTLTYNWARRTLTICTKEISRLGLLR